MDQIRGWIGSHPEMAVFIGLFLAIVLVLAFKVFFGSGSEENTIGATVEDAEDPEMTKVTILASDGKVIEEFTAIRDSLVWNEDDSPSIRFDTKEKEDIVFLLGTYSVKIVDL